MNALEITALLVGGGIGAGARYVLDGAIMRGRSGAFPLGVLVVNVLGSFLLGLLTGIPHVAAVWLTILGVGVLGGFTTFSTVAVETALLAQRGRRDWAWVNLVGTLVACAPAASAPTTSTPPTAAGALATPSTATSTATGMREATTGQPQSSASSKGMPKPSARDG